MTKKDSTPKTSMTRADWANLTKKERTALIQERRDEAVDLVKNSNMPKGIRIATCGQELVATPSGTTNRGSVSYRVGRSRFPAPLVGYDVMTQAFVLTLIPRDAGGDFDGGSDVI